MIPGIDTLGVTLPRAAKKNATGRVNISLPDSEDEIEITVYDGDCNDVVLWTTRKGARALAIALQTVAESED